MVRFVRLLLALVVVTTGANVVTPARVAAASTIAAETPLLATTDPGAPVVAILPVGTAVTLTGPPQGALYPIQATGLTGWVDGAALAVVKDPPPEAPAPPSAPTVAATLEANASQPPATGSPAAIQASDAAGPDAEVATSAGIQAPAVAPAAGATLAQETDAPTGATATGTPIPMPSAQPVSSEQAATPTPDAASTGESEPVATNPAPAETDAAAPPETPVADATVIPAEPAPADPSPTDPAEATMATTPPPSAPATETPVSTATATSTPTATPTATPEQTATPDPTPRPQPRTGPATAKWDAPLREWPGEASPLVFTVPAGATVEQLGDVSDGHVYATYMWMWGWIPLDALGPPAPPAAEAVPDDADEAEVRTPRPGTGLARTTVDLSLRAGPSAGERAIALVPAGSKVEQTGVMENGFQRVVWDGQIGWIAGDYLELPATPTPETVNGRPNGKPEYTEREIVKIIYAAADHYGQDREDMLRVARCESNLDPYAVHPSGSYGLFQFIRSTWESTPYGNEDIFDPHANAMAAGWMWAEGRRSEWVCK